MHKNTGKYCFTHTTGQDVFLFTLKNKKGTEILISNYGAIMTSYGGKKHIIKKQFIRLTANLFSSFIFHSYRLVQNSLQRKFQDQFSV